MFLGLRTTIYPAPDLAAGKAFFVDLLGVEPYFDQPFYVGFSVGGFELGLDPAGDPADGVQSYWGVADAAVAMQRLLATGASVHTEVHEVGDGIRVGLARGPGGLLIGVIENPHFVAEEVSPAGPGR